MQTLLTPAFLFLVAVVVVVVGGRGSFELAMS